MPGGNDGAEQANRLDELALMRENPLSALRPSSHWSRAGAIRRADRWQLQTPTRHIARLFASRPASVRIAERGAGFSGHLAPTDDQPIREKLFCDKHLLAPPAVLICG